MMTDIQLKHVVPKIKFVILSNLNI